MISVVIPCFNNSKTLEQSIRSVLNQDVTCSIEIIIVDDCSSDLEDIISIIDEITSENIKYEIKLVTSNKNRGGGASRNIGISIAQGDYIAFLDADDIWFKNKLRKQLNSYTDGTILTSRVRKGCSIDNSIVLPNVVKSDDEYVSDSIFTKSKLIQTSTFFMSSEIAKRIMFNEKLPRHQDYDFLLRAENLGIKIIQSDDVLSFWRVEDKSNSVFLKKNASSEFFIQWFNDYKKYLTHEASVSYVAKNIFSSCVISKKPYLFLTFIFGNGFDFRFIIQVFLLIIKWRFMRIFNYV